MFPVLYRYNDMQTLNIWNVNFEERGASNESSVEVYV